MQKKLTAEATERKRAESRRGSAAPASAAGRRSTMRTQESSAASGKSKLGGFSRAIRLLDEITAHGPLRFAELEERLQLPKATLHRALNDLILERLIQFDDRSLNYTAGFRVLELANQIWAKSDIRTLARDQLEKLCEISNETVQLSVLADLHTVYIDSIESSNTIRMSMNVGNKVPVYCSAPGKALLAGCSYEEQKSIISRLAFAEFTSNTITNPQQLLNELETINNDGIAREDEEHFLGIKAIAANIVDNAGIAVASISITAPTFRANDDQFENWKKALRLSVADISSRLAPVTRI